MRRPDELAAVVRDLPADSATGPGAESGPSRELLLVFVVAIVTLVLLGVALALR